jgi:hypothetical protein
MTIVEALSRLANGYCSSRYAGLSAAQQLEGVDALNAGLMELFGLLPDCYKDKALSLSVEAPAALTIQAVSGSAMLAAPAFTEAQVGRTVKASGDPAEHRVAGASALRDTWLGETGTHDAVVYHDYVYGDVYPFNRLLSEPKLVCGSVELALRKINPENLDLELTRGVGRPRYYWLEAGGVSQGETVAAAIRLLPLPDVAYRIRVRACYWPRRIKFADVAANAPLPVPDQLADALVQIAGYHTLGLTGWDAMTPSEVVAKADRGRATASTQPAHLSVPTNRVGTPRGY